MPAGFPGLPAGWVTEHDTFPSADAQVQLFGTLHRRVEPSRRGDPSHSRALFVLHGMGEHGGRYAHFPHYLQSCVDYVYCMDQRGHGRSGGLRGHVERFDQLVDDLAAGLRHFESVLQKWSPHPRVSLLAHSMGGLVGLRALLLQPGLNLASAMLSSPMLAIKAHVPLAKKLAAKLLAHTWGSLQLPTGIDATQLSHDPEVAIAYRKDRLVHDKMTPRFYEGVTEAMADALARHDGVRPPLLALLPMGDAIIDPAVSLEYFEALEHSEKEIACFPGFYHESANELGKEAFFGKVAAFIGEH